MSGGLSGYIRQHHVGLIAIFLILGGTAVAASQPGSDGDFDACFEKKTGDLDLLKKGKCDKGEKAVSWGVQGPQGPAGADGAAGATGAPGADGSAIAFGRVNNDGTVGQSKSIAGVSHPQTGIYCVSVTGANPSERPMVINTEYNGSSQQQGIANASAGADPLINNSASSFTAQWDSIPNFCGAGTYEVRTVRIRINPGDDSFSMQPDDGAFSFSIP